MIRNERTESDFFLSFGCFHPALSRRLSPERGEPLWSGDKASPASHAHHCVCVFECVCVLVTGGVGIWIKLIVALPSVVFDSEQVRLGTLSCLQCEL